MPKILRFHPLVQLCQQHSVRNLSTLSLCCNDQPLINGNLWDEKILSPVLQEAFQLRCYFQLLDITAFYLHSALFFLEIMDSTEGLSLTHSCS